MFEEKFISFAWKLFSVTNFDIWSTYICTYLFMVYWLRVWVAHTIYHQVVKMNSEKLEEKKSGSKQTTPNLRYRVKASSHVIIQGTIPGSACMYWEKPENHSYGADLLGIRLEPWVPHIWWSKLKNFQLNYQIYE